MILPLFRNHYLSCLLQSQILQQRTKYETGSSLCEAVINNQSISLTQQCNSKAIWIALVCQRFRCPKHMWVSYLIEIWTGWQAERMGKSSDIPWNYAENRAMDCYRCGQMLQVSSCTMNVALLQLVVVSLRSLPFLS